MDEIEKIASGETFGSSQEIEKIASALAKAQGSFTNPTKNRHVDFTANNGRRIKYSYSDLPGILDMSRKSLSDNELSITHLTKNIPNAIILRAMLLHSSGQYFFSELQIPQIQDPQALGSILTYYRRYTVCGLLNIAADEDDDGQAGKDAVQSQKKSESPKAGKDAQKPANSPDPKKIDSAPAAAIAAPKPEDIKIKSGKMVSELKEKLSKLDLAKFDQAGFESMEEKWISWETKLTPDDYKAGKTEFDDVRKRKNFIATPVEKTAETKKTLASGEEIPLDHPYWNWTLPEKKQFCPANHKAVQKEGKWYLLADEEVK